jgi:putative two-component system response regulator
MDLQRLRSAKILIVDDEATNITLLENILRLDGYTNIRSTADPCLALGLIQEFAPDLVILDLHMPGLSGFDVMELVRQEMSRQEAQALEEISSEALPQALPAYLPIMVVSGDYSSEVKMRALASGAKDFLTRPFNAIEIQLRIQNLLEARFLQLDLQEQNELLEEHVRARTEELDVAQLGVKEAHIEIIVRLALAGELRDNDTGEHTKRVSLVASLIAQNLGLPPEQIELLRRAAPLHDVGKIGVADPILLKPGRLSEEEFELIKTHCTIGAQVLSGGNAELVQMAERIALTHHEHWDGSGYPQGLKGEEIPIEARILAVADVFDALTHERPYKPAWAARDAVEEITRQSGMHFDPRVVEAFLNLPHEELL